MYRFIAPEWFKLKKYPHIGKPIEGGKSRQVVGYIMSPAMVDHHQFRPLLRRTVITYPHRREAADGSKRRKAKERPLTYASHIDANIYSYYSDCLQKKYEEFIAQEGLNEVVVAYRRIPCANGEGNKCNIHVADDVFKYVKKELAANKEVAVVTFDIKGFFDNLDHKLIKRMWKQTMGEVDMPLDEYKVYKSVTHYSYVEEEAIYNLFKDRIHCRKADKLCVRPVKCKIDLRKHHAEAYCTTDDIKEIKQHGLIQEHRDTKGIPQGLPISAALANIYMRDFDVKVNKYVQSVGGIYKRYSDDIIVVCPIPVAADCKRFVMESIQDVKLEIEDRKTNLYEIKLLNGRPVCFHEHKGINKPVEYLGFSFDGNRVLLKSASLGRYYSKMYKDKRRHKRWTIAVNNATNGIVFTNQIIRRFTLAGAQRHHKLRHLPNGQCMQLSEKTYGNYLTYAYKAASLMNEPAIKHQLRRNLYRVKKNIAEIKYDSWRVHRAQLIAKQKIYF